MDDFLEHYIRQGALEGYPICGKILELTAEQTWMRDPQLQCEEEFQIYEEIFKYVLADLERVDCKKSVITEGAAYVPKLMKRLGIPHRRYIAVTPAKEFQISHYKKREFVPYVLEGCSDREKAFSNWMDRDILFAEEVQKQCGEEKYASIFNDGSIKIEELVNRVAIHFGLNHAG